MPSPAVPPNPPPGTEGLVPWLARRWLISQPAACQVCRVRYAQDALLPRLTPARVRCSLPADAVVVVRTSALEAAALAQLE